MGEKASRQANRALVICAGRITNGAHWIDGLGENIGFLFPCPHPEESHPTS